MKYLGTLRRKIVIPPLLSIKYFSLPEIFWNTEWFPGEVFSVLWDKKVFDKTVKLPPSFAWNFSIPEIFRNTEEFSYEFYRQWDKDFSTEFSDIPIFCIKICDARNFLKHRSVP